MKKRIIIISTLIVLVALVALLALGYAYNSRTVSKETAEDIPGLQTQTKTPTNTPGSPVDTGEPEPTTQTIGTAVLSGVSGRKTSGNVTLIHTSEGVYIRLEDNFDSSASAPDNRVYLGNASGHQLEIAKLKAIKGGQNFPVPANVDISQYTHIWIHCKAFNTTYGKGEIIHS